MRLWMLPKEYLPKSVYQNLKAEKPRPSKPKITNLMFTLNKEKLLAVLGVFKNYSELCPEITKKATDF